MRVVNIIRNLDPPGRFLAPNSDSDKNCKEKDGSIVWHDVGDKKARAKASQCLREKKIDSISGHVSESSSLQARTRNLEHHSFSSDDTNTDDNSMSFCVDSEQRKFPYFPEAPTSFHPSTKAYCNESVSHYQNLSKVISNVSSQDSDSMYYQLKAPTAQLVTPCQPAIGTQRVWVSESHQIGEGQMEDKDENLECDSWVRSFCSIETRMIEESESMSPLSPPMLKSIYRRNDQNFPMQSSWASSDVRSDITDNSHTDDL